MFVPQIVALTCGTVHIREVVGSSPTATTGLRPHWLTPMGRFAEVERRTGGIREGVVRAEVTGLGPPAKVWTPSNDCLLRRLPMTHDAPPRGQARQAVTALADLGVHTDASKHYWEEQSEGDSFEQADGSRPPQSQRSRERS